MFEKFEDFFFKKPGFFIFGVFFLIFGIIFAINLAVGPPPECAEYGLPIYIKAGDIMIPMETCREYKTTN